MNIINKTVSCIQTIQETVQRQEPAIRRWVPFALAAGMGIYQGLSSSQSQDDTLSSQLYSTAESVATQFMIATTGLVACQWSASKLALGGIVAARMSMSQSSALGLVGQCTALALLFGPSTLPPPIQPRKSLFSKQSKPLPAPLKQTLFTAEVLSGSVMVANTLSQGLNVSTILSTSVVVGATRILSHLTFKGTEKAEDIQTLIQRGRQILISRSTIALAAGVSTLFFGIQNPFTPIAILAVSLPYAVGRNTKATPQPAPATPMSPKLPSTWKLALTGACCAVASSIVMATSNRFESTP